MRKLSIFTFVLVMIITNNLFGNFVEIPDNSEKQLFECINSDNRLTELKFSLTGYERETIRHIADSDEYQKITCADEGFIAEEGLPDLPRITRLIAIPNESSVSIEIINIEKEILSDIDIYPYQPEQGDKPELMPFVKDFDFYDKDEVYPSKIVEIGKPAILRDIRVVNVTINPFQYNPQKRELHIIKNADIRVTYNKNASENIKTRDKKLSRFFEPLYRSVIINYDEVLETKEYQHGSYLFIYQDDATTAAYLQYLATWKHQKGFEVVSASFASGTSASTIKTYIQNAYDTWPNPPEFICLVGDADGSFTIPTWFESWSGYNGEGDHPYTQLEGNDILPDAYIGRLSFNTYNEFLTIINKILHYEKEPYIDQTDWYKSVLLVGDTYPSGQSCIITNKYIKELMLSAGDYSFTELYGPSPSVSQMVDAVNNGVSFFNYRGWLGMSGWSNSTTYSLNNGFMLPVVVTLTCGTGDFYGTSGRTEVFLKAGSPTLPKGGIAAIGTATMGTHTRFNNPVSSGIYYGIFVEQTYNMGGALARGKLNLYNCFPDNPGNCVEIYSYWNNLMGDPGMEIWTDIPSELIVSYSETIPYGSNFIEVSVEDQLGDPISEAWVTALKGDDEIFSTAFTDENGIAIIPFEPSDIGQVSLTVTKHNFIPYLGSFDIIQESYSVNYYDVVIDDDNSGTSSGNNDGNLNPGENVELIVSLKNFGERITHSVTAQLSTENEWITIIDNYEDYGNIFPGNIGLPGDDFDIEIDPACLGGTELVFNLLIQDVATHQWSGKFYLKVEGPYLHPNSYSVINGGNGILDPGETAELEVTLENIGSVVANEVNGVLMCSDNRIIIEDSLGYFGNIPAGGQATNNSNRFEVTANAQIILGSQFVLDLYIYNSDGYDNTVNFILEVGEVSVTDPLGPDGYGYYCYDDGDTDYYNVPTYQWIEIDPNYGGSGTLIPLNDNGENQEDIDTLSLPFIFRFYGQEHNEITVCSNAWIAMGQTEQATFRNWPIPGPMGPSPMIAPFWDDLFMGGGNVYYFYDTGGHYYIVEWSRVKNRYDNSLEIFEVILYDPNYYPTSLNDGEIKFQYHTVNNVDQGAGYTGGHYATVGIENVDATIGLEYTYNNDYPTAAKILEDEMALLFTGPPIPHEEPYIVLGGIIINDENGNGLVDYGEDVNLDITLNNIGENTATGVYAILYSSDNYITITSDSSIYNNIPGGSSGLNLTEYSFSVVDTCPDGHIISFQVSVIGNENNWNRNFGLEVNAPQIEYCGIVVNDGDNNMLDPGETADILVSFINNGSADAYSAVVSISTDDSYLTINSASFNFGTFSAGEIDTAIFNVTADEAAPIGHSVIINWEIAAEYSYATADEFRLFIGLSIEDFETGDFSSYSWTQGGNADWTVATENPYEGTYCAKSGIITHSQTSELLVNMDISSDSDISFYRKVSSESNWDYLRFYIDGSQQGAWSGEVPWGEESYSVSAGNHTFKWAYEKDYIVSHGSDCAWIDYIIFPAIGTHAHPNISVNPTAFSEILAQGDSTERTLTIANSGNADLTYSISKEYEGEFTHLISRINRRDSGGPDGFGYLWIDSDEPGGPVYDWVDISGVGIPVTFTHNDVGAGPFDIGFDFTFYGETYNEFIISPNGWIGFGDDNTTWSNTSIPSPSAPKPAILAFWDDLDPLLGGDVYYYSNGIDSLVVWFNNVEHWHTTPGTYDFEIIIHSTGNIIYQYMSVSGVLNSATIGIQNESGTIGLEVVYNENYVHNNLTVEFYYPVEWLRLNKYSGTVSPGEADILTLTLDASELDLGDYHCDLNIISNDPNSSLIVIPVDLTVIEIYAPPDTVTNIIISIVGDSIQLSWDSVTEDINGNPIQVDYYKIYCTQTDPYFSPSPENLIGITSESSFNDILSNRSFYIVTAVYQETSIIQKPIKTKVNSQDARK